MKWIARVFLLFQAVCFLPCVRARKPKESAVILVWLSRIILWHKFTCCPVNFVSGDIYILICLSMDIGEKKFFMVNVLSFNFYNIVCGTNLPRYETQNFTFGSTVS